MGYGRGFCWERLERKKSKKKKYVQVKVDSSNVLSFMESLYFVFLRIVIIRSGLKTADSFFGSK